MESKGVLTGERQSGSMCILFSAQIMDEGEHLKIHNVLEVESRSDRPGFRINSVMRIDLDSIEWHRPEVWGISMDPSQGQNTRCRDWRQATVL